jgi:hypothetical protein
MSHTNTRFIRLIRKEDKPVISDHNSGQEKCLTFIKLTWESRLVLTKDLKTKYLQASSEIRKKLAKLFYITVFVNPRKSRVSGKETRQPLFIIWNEPFASIFGDTISFAEQEEDEEEEEKRAKMKDKRARVKNLIPLLAQPRIQNRLEQIREIFQTD